MAGDTPRIWTIKRCLDWSRDYLRDKGEQRPRFMAEQLLVAVLGIGRMEMYMYLDKPMDKPELDLMHSYLVRRLKGEPLQYIVGNTQFRTIEVACERGVLIPRPETEMLVEEVLAYLDREVFGVRPGELPRRPRAELPWNAEVEQVRRAEEERLRREHEAAVAGEAGIPVRDVSESEGDGAKTPGPDADVDAAGGAPMPFAEPASPEPSLRMARVLEIGSGTGCIPLSLATERPGQVSCVSIDINPQAIALARRNRDALGIDPKTVDFREGDLVSPVLPSEQRTFDLLISNPPYIPVGVAAQMSREVLDFEPGDALFSGYDGLDMFRRIVECAPQMLAPGGLLACELHEDSLEAAAQLCRYRGMEDVQILRDLAGKTRFIFARTSSV